MRKKRYNIPFEYTHTNLFSWFSKLSITHFKRIINKKTKLPIKNKFSPHHPFINLFAHSFKLYAKHIPLPLKIFCKYPLIKTITLKTPYTVWNCIDYYTTTNTTQAALSTLPLRHYTVYNCMANIWLTNTI